MKTIREVLVPEHTVEYLDTITCELCGHKTHNEDFWPNDCKHGNIGRTTILLEEGYSCPEGGKSTKTIIDICPSCFIKVLIPYLEYKGADARTEEVDY